MPCDCLINNEKAWMETHGNWKSAVNSLHWSDIPSRESTRLQKSNLCAFRLKFFSFCFYSQILTQLLEYPIDEYRVSAIQAREFPIECWKLFVITVVFLYITLMKFVSLSQPIILQAKNQLCLVSFLDICSSHAFEFSLAIDHVNPG